MTGRPGAAAALLTCLAVLAACGDGGQAETDGTAADAPGAEATTEEQTGAPDSDGGAASEDVARIPDGRYVRVATEADGEALDLDPELVGEFLGRDGELPMALEFDGASWKHYVTNDAGVEELGDLGTLDYPEDGTVVSTSESTGCPGCTAAVEWSLDGPDLTLELAEERPPDEAFHIQGVWTREDG